MLATFVLAAIVSTSLSEVIFVEKFEGKILKLEKY
jgi:hypothetical protein